MIERTTGDGTTTTQEPLPGGRVRVTVSNPATPIRPSSIVPAKDAASALMRHLHEIRATAGYQRRLTEWTKE